MSFRSLFARLTTKVAAVVVLAATGGVAVAADVYAPPPPPAYGPAYGPAVGGDTGCPTCQHGLPAATCTTCGKLRPPHGWVVHSIEKKKQPYPVHLCPGACFGYFQTQWRKWDDVCPYPYLGQGQTDAPRPGGAPKVPGTPLPPPHPIDPMKMPDPKKPGGSDAPIILPPPPGKFNP